LPESAGDVELSVVPVRAFAAGEDVQVVMTVRDVVTQQVVAQKAVKAVDAKAAIQSLSFPSEHGVIRGNPTPGNLTTSGIPLPTTKWAQSLDTRKVTSNLPVSHTINQKIKVHLILKVAGVANNTPYKIVGSNADFQFLNFEGTGMLQVNENNTGV